MYFTGEMIPIGRTNKGTLILPPIELYSLNIREKNGQKFTSKQLEGDWGMLIIVGRQCDQQCKKVLNVTERVHVALNQNSDRVRRYVLVDNQSEQQTDSLPSGFDQMQSLFINTALVKKKLQNAGINISGISILLVDPLGNIMMYYKNNQIGKDVVKDLQKLLRVSNIG